MASVVANLGLTLEVISVARRSLKDGEGTIVAVTNSVRSNLVNNRSTLVPNRNVSLIANRTVVSVLHSNMVGVNTIGVVNRQSSIRTNHSRRSTLRPSVGVRSGTILCGSGKGNTILDISRIVFTNRITVNRNVNRYIIIGFECINSVNAVFTARSGKCNLNHSGIQVGNSTSSRSLCIGCENLCGRITTLRSHIRSIEERSVVRDCELTLIVCYKNSIVENAIKNDRSFSIANREDNGIRCRTTDRVSNRHDSHVVMIAAIRNDIHNSGVESREDIHTFTCPSVAHVSACRISVASVSIKYANGHPTVCRAIRTSSATVRNFSYMDVRDRIDMQEIESRESLTTIVVGHLQLEDEVARTNRIDTGLFCIFIGESNFTTIHF